MHLHSLYVENYRAVRKASLTFDSTTVLIGENETGKSSLLHVLNKILNPDHRASSLQFESSHFHRAHDTNEITGPILIRIFFCELFNEEWSDEIYHPISPLLYNTAEKKRKLILEILASPVSKGNVEGNFKIFLDGSEKQSSDPELFSWCQKMNPVIHLTAGMLTGRGVDNIPALRPSSLRLSSSQKISSIIKRIETSAYQLLTGESTNNMQVIEEGFKAACQFIEHFRKQSDSKRPGLARRISDIIGKDRDLKRGSLSLSCIDQLNKPEPGQKYPQGN